jgi:hypothetical protein
MLFTESPLDDAEEDEEEEDDECEGDGEATVWDGAGIGWRFEYDGNEDMDKPDMDEAKEEMGPPPAKEPCWDAGADLSHPPSSFASSLDVACA